MSQRLIFVGGKGGVGRSTVTAGIALDAAASGRRVLAVDAVGAGGLAAALGHSSDVVRGQVTELDEGPHLIELDTQSSLVEYLRIYLNISVPSNIGPLSRIFEFVATAAPGVKEILTVGKVAHEVRSEKWDLVVVDGPATGHIVELLDAPRSLHAIAPTGPLASQTDWMTKILSAESAGLVIVSLAEELPTAESLELLARVRAETPVAQLGIVVNRWPEPLTGVSRSVAAGLAVDGHRYSQLAEIAIARWDEAQAQVGLLPFEFPQLMVGESSDPVSEVAEVVGPWLEGSS